VTPTETYVIPAPTISLATGGTSISGAVPAGLSGAVNGDYRCDLNYQPQAVGAGAFSVPYPKILPGEWVQLILHDAVGNITALGTSTPGETPCVSLTGTGSTLPPPGSPPPPGDYSINVGHLLASGGASVRVVIRRGTSAYFDESVDNMYLNGAVTTRPSPGDVVDIYRPKTAPAPTYSIAVPNVSAKFDAAADLVAVDTPAGGDIRAYACRAYGCNNENSRGLRGLVAGRQLLNFHVAEGVYVPVDIHPTDIVNVYFHDVDFTIEYGFQATPGDLVAPIQSFKLPSKLKVSALLKALKKGYKVKLTSNEVGTAKLSLGKFAKVTKSVKPGSNTITLKFSKSGKKAIKKLAAKGKKAKPLSVSLTSVVTDASGNASTLVKKTKIKR
jgi:hypothetical protein